MRTNIKTQKLILAILAACSFGVATAGEVSGLTSFSSGSKAVASEVNGNFNAVKAAVDNNNSRLGTVEPEVMSLGARATGLENKVTNLEAWAASNEITANRVSNEVDVLQNSMGIISINGSEFRVSDDNAFCTGGISTQGMSWYSGTGCYAMAGLHFPNRSIIDGLACFVRDNDATFAIAVTLFYKSIADPSPNANVVTGTAYSSDTSGIQTLFQYGANHVVNNFNYTYFLRAYISGNANTDNLIVSCKVEYDL